MSDWKEALKTIRDKHLNNKATIKGDNAMTDKITIGVKFTEQYGLRVDAPPTLINKRANLLIDRVAGKLALKFDTEGNLFSSNNLGQKSMINFGQRHLGNIRKFTSEYTQYDAVLTADGLFINGFELPKAASHAKRQTRVTSTSKPTLGRAHVSHANDEATVANLKTTLRDLNYYGRQLGVEWDIEDGKVIGNINVKRKI